MIKLIETRQWQVTTSSRRIPAESAEQSLQSCEWLSKAREIYDQTLHQVADLRAQAHQQGYQAGLEQAQQELLESMLAAVENTRQFQNSQQQHVLNLAVAMVQRLLPKLSAEDLLLSMLSETFSELEGERQLQVYVHPNQRLTTETWLKQWRLEHPDIRRLEVVDDPQLDLLSCRVESELGVLSVDPLKELANLSGAVGKASATD